MAIEATGSPVFQGGSLDNVAMLRSRVDKAWDAYVLAATTAQQSLRREDGIAAGRAWRLFVREFSHFDGDRP